MMEQLSASVTEQLETKLVADMEANGGTKDDYFVGIHTIRDSKLAAKCGQVPWPKFDEQQVAEQLAQKPGPGTYALCLRRLGVPQTKGMATLIVEPILPAIAPVQQPTPAPVTTSPAAACRTDNVAENLLAMVIANGQNQTQLLATMMQASSQQNATMMQTLAGMVQTRTQDRTPVDEVLKLMKIMEDRDRDDSSSLIDAKAIQAAVAGFTSAMRADGQRQPQTAFTPVYAPPAASPAIAPPPAAPIRTDASDSTSKQQRLVEVVTGFLRMAYSSPDNSLVEVGATLSDLLETMGCDSKDLAESMEHGSLSALVNQWAPEVPLEWLHGVETQWRGLMAKANNDDQGDAGEEGDE